jgi:hypothetical protein
MNEWFKTIGAVSVLCCCSFASGCNRIELDPMTIEVPDDGPAADVAPAPNLLAVRWSQLTPFLTPYGTDAYNTFYNPDADPDDIVILFSSEVQTCGAPLILRNFELETLDSGVCDESDDFWQIALVVPADLAAPGLFDLAGPSLWTHAAALRVEDEDFCDWGAPTACCAAGIYGPVRGAGTFEIVSVDATTITFNLDAEPQPSLNPDAVEPDPWKHDVLPAGSYVATLCP